MKTQGECPKAGWNWKWFNLERKTLSEDLCSYSLPFGHSFPCLQGWGRVNSRTKPMSAWFLRGQQLGLLVQLEIEGKVLKMKVSTEGKARKSQTLAYLLNFTSIGQIPRTQQHGTFVELKKKWAEISADVHNKGDMVWHLILVMLEDLDKHLGHSIIALGQWSLKRKNIRPELRISFKREIKCYPYNMNSSIVTHLLE